MRLGIPEGVQAFGIYVVPGPRVNQVISVATPRKTENANIMSNPALNWAYAQDLRDPIAKAVLVALANRLNGKTGRLDPKIPQLARDIGASRRTVEGKLKMLRDLGLVRSTRRQRTNEYELVMRKPCASESAPDAHPDAQITTSRCADPAHPDAQTLRIPIENRNLNRKEPEGDARYRSLSETVVSVPHTKSRVALKTIDEMIEVLDLRAFFEGTYGKADDLVADKLRQALEAKLIGWLRDRHHSARASREAAQGLIEAMDRDRRERWAERRDASVVLQ